MEHWSANWRRGPAGAHLQTRHAHDGWIVNNRVGSDLDSAVGKAVERLCLDHHLCDPGLRRRRIRRRLSEAGETAQPGIDRPAEAFFSVDYRLLRLVGFVPINQLLKYQQFMERQYSLFKTHTNHQ